MSRTPLAFTGFVIWLVATFGIAYGVVEWRGNDGVGSPGPRGERGEQGPPGPAATANENALACAALLENPDNGLSRDIYLDMVDEFCR